MSRRLPFAFVTVLFSWLLLLSVSLVPAAQDICNPDLPPRLTPGGMGYVTVTDNPRAVRMRTQPSTSAEILGQFEEGMTFVLTDAPPVCAEGITWWEIEAEVGGGGLTAYIAEGVDGEYFVEPYVPGNSGSSAPVTGGGTPQITVFDYPLPTLTPDDTMPTFDESSAAWNWAAGESYLSEYNIPSPLLMQLPDAYAGNMPSLPVDLSQVAYLDDAALSPEQLAVLATNGFVVVPGGKDWFENTLWVNAETGRSDFITTDMMLNNLYWLYRYALMYLEGGALYQQLTTALGVGYIGAKNQYEQLRGTALEDAARDAVVYYLVALSLLDTSTMAESDPGIDQGLIRVLPSDFLIETDPEMLALAQPYIDAARAAQGQAEIAFLEDYTEDFGLYNPISHYETSPLLRGYFQAITWLGRINFSLSSEADTQRALLIARAMSYEGGEEAWSSISDLLDFLVGPIDDLSITDYLPIMRQAYSDDLPLEAFDSADNLAAFYSLAESLPGPSINSLLLPIGTSAEDMRAEGRGFRLMGGRYTLDGYFMQQLMDPDIPGRVLPTTLDIGAAFGSDMAYSLVEMAGLADYPEYQSTIAALREDVGGLTPDDWFDTMYGAWLWSLQPLTARNPALEPPLMQTDAWQRKSLQTAFGSYTELKNATAAYVKMPEGLGGGGETLDVTTYTVVEPNPLVFARAAIASMRLADELEARGYDQYPLVRLVIDGARTNAYLTAMAAEMARRQIAGEPIPQDWLLFYQHYFRGNYGYVRITLMQYDPDPPLNVALTAAAAASPAGFLQLATGKADYIYVVTDRPEGLQLNRGGVYSFYEYLNDSGQTIPDSVWRDRVDAGDVPPRPDWIDLFFVP